MIRDSGGKGFVPGSAFPTRPRVEVTDEAILSYLDAGSWTQGFGVVVIGDGVTTTTQAMSIMKQVFQIDPEVDPYYWTEADYLADLRNLWRFESMTQSLTNDSALWGEYVEWEQDFWRLKESGFLLLDEMGRSYTPMQWYEVESLLRFRLGRSLPTMTATTTGRWENIADDLKAVMTHNNVVVSL